MNKIKELEISAAESITISSLAVELYNPKNIKWLYNHKFQTKFNALKSACSTKDVYDGGSTFNEAYVIFCPKPGRMPVSHWNPEKRSCAECKYHVDSEVFWEVEKDEHGEHHMVLSKKSRIYCGKPLGMPGDRAIAELMLNKKRE